MDKSGAVAPAEAGEIDLMSIGRAVWRRKWWVIGPTLVVALVTTIAVNLITPRYTSEARILYEGRENVFLRPQAERNVIERAGADEEALASQVQLILSRELALKVIAELKLNTLPEFDPLIDGLSPLKRFLVLIGVSRDPRRLTPTERVLASYYKRLTAYTIEKSRVITVEFTSFNPILAAKAVNAVAEGYLTLQQRAKQQDVRASSQWLSGEIKVLRQKVADAEARAENFRARSNLFVGTNNTMLSNQQLGEFNSQLATARAQKSDAETRARLIRDMLRRGEPIEASEIVNSELVRRLSEQRVALRAQLAEQSSTLLGGHPRIKELKAQLANLDRQIRAEAEKLVRTLENDAKIAEARVEALKTNLESLKQQAASTSEDDVRLRALEREARAQRELLESYLAKFREASARGNIGSAPADARIISRGIVSNTPSFPKKLPIVLIATLATLVTSVAMIATSELLRANEPQLAPAAPAPAWPVQPSVLERLAPVGPSEPSLEISRALVPAALEEPAAERISERVSERRSIEIVSSIDELAGKLLAGGPGRCVAFFGSAGQATGATASSHAALAVARLAAREALVALVQLLADSPQTKALAGDTVDAPGVTDLIAGKASFGDIIMRDPSSRAHIVPHGRLAIEPAQSVGSLRLVTMIDALTRTYDLVILDAGPVGAVALEGVAAIAPRGVLVASDADDAGLPEAQARLEAAGYGGALMLVRASASAPQPEMA